MSETLKDGDLQWFIPLSGGKPIQVEIKNLFEENGIQCVNVVEVLDLKYRTLALSQLFDTAKLARIDRKGLVK